MRIADLYIRVSTDEQADKGYSQRNQEEVLCRYCDMNYIQVRKVVYEDHSAKTFNRPAWSRLIADLRKSKGKSDLIIFTKWDRFSRNAGDAYQMINQLRSLGVEPQAIEQPLDMSIPENKIMLAVYLATPEVENDRRALNVFHGMRRAKKEGRWMGTAPIGYKNKTMENGDKYIGPKEPEAGIMKWVFQEIAACIYNTEQIWKSARLKGLKCSKNNFWMAIRNPVYCGKIHVPKYKEEESMFVQGKHLAIISEALYYEVQQVLDGRRKKQRTKTVVDDMLPLRGFLVCPKCGKMLTGSASKGHTKHYHYYHCVSSCGSRYKADKANELFATEIKKYVPRPAFREIYKQAILFAFKSQTKTNYDERRQLLNTIDALSDQIKEARNLLFSKEIDPADYRESKADYERQISELEARLSEVPQNNYNIEGIVSKALEILCQLDILYNNGTIEEKRKIISSIFPEKLIFDGVHYRTARINEAANLIYTLEQRLSQKEKGTNLSEKDLSLMVIPLGAARIFVMSCRICV